MLLQSHKEESHSLNHHFDIAIIYYYDFLKSPENAGLFAIGERINYPQFPF